MSHFSSTITHGPMMVSVPGCASVPQPPSYRKKNLSMQFPKELYQRSDLPCHTLLCDDALCHAIGSSKSGAMGIEVEHVGLLDPMADHYIVPSYHALDRFHDIFTRHHSLYLILVRTHFLLSGRALERRLFELLADGSATRRAIRFENEFHVATKTIQRVEENSAQRGERAVRRAAKFFASHLRGRKTIICIEEGEAPTLQTMNAQMNTSKQYPRESGGVLFHTMSTYFQWLRSRPPSLVANAPALPDVEALSKLHQALLDSEKQKLQLKLEQIEAAKQLDSMLATLKQEWKLRRSSSGVTQEEAQKLDAPVDETTGQPILNVTAPSTTALDQPTITLSPSNDIEYDQHLPVSLALEAVQRGLLYRGHLRVNKYHAQSDAAVDLGGRTIDRDTGILTEVQEKGAINSPNTVNDVFISGNVDRNRALDGDEVVVQMLPPSMWKAPTQRKMIAVKGEDEKDDEEDDSDSGDESVSRVPTGRIVSILQRNQRPYVCTLQLETAGGDFSLVVPMNECIPKIRVRTHQIQELANQRLLVQIDAWEVNSRYPSGVYLKALGPIHQLETGVRCLLHEHQISHPEFSINMIKSLPERNIDLVAAKDRKFKVGSGYHSRGAPTPFTWEIPASAMEDRLDLRQTHREAVCSIDPIGCEDIDDALSCLELPNGNVQIGVHIADVSYFVPAGSLLDQEAARRGTSVYLTDRRLDMLPAVLSSDLCSLRGGCDRLCLSVMWEIKPSTGEVVSTWYGRTAIYNSFALSYEEAQLIFDTEGGTKPIPSLPASHPDAHLTIEERYDAAPRSSLTAAEKLKLFPKIKHLLQLGRILREKRLEVGALELDSLTIKFRMDAEKNIIGVQNEAELEVHSTIAEWMVFCNSTVAYHIYKVFPSSALLRHHPYPAPHRFAAMQEMAKNLGLQLDVSSNKALAISLSKAEQIVQSKAFQTNSAAAKELLSSNKSSSDSASVMDEQQSKAWIMKLLKEMAARAMSEAQYISSGSVAHVRDFFHYGLSADFYTHHTSPIRRYSDLIVHRQMLQVIELEKQEKMKKKFEKKAIKAEARGDAFPTAVVTASSSASSLLSPTFLFTNETLSTLARHLNFKNRNAKIAGSESQDLFLASYLSGNSSSSSESAPRPRVERCEALIVSLRSNGFIVLLPKYHVKGALLLVDRQSSSQVVHPLQSTDQQQQGEDSPQKGPRATVQYKEAQQELTFTMNSALPIPSSSASSSPSLVKKYSNLPLSRTFHVFDPIVVDVSLRAHQSRYRVPKPTFQLVWCATSAQENAVQQKPSTMGTLAQANADSATTSLPSEIDLAVTTPAAPAGARKQRNATTAAESGASSLYKTFQQLTIAPKVESMTAAEVKALKIAKEEEEKKSIGEMKLHRFAPKIKKRYTAASGGRKMWNPSGAAIPTAMLKTTILLANKEQEEEEYYEED